jgi:hypothetical protein
MDEEQMNMTPTPSSTMFNAQLKQAEIIESHLAAFFYEKLCVPIRLTPPHTRCSVTNLFRKGSVLLLLIFLCPIDAWASGDVIDRWYMGFLLLLLGACVIMVAVMVIYFIQLNTNHKSRENKNNNG